MHSVRQSSLQKQFAQFDVLDAYCLMRMRVKAHIEQIDCTSKRVLD